MISRLKTARRNRQFARRAHHEMEAQRFVAELMASSPDLSAPGRLAPFEKRVFSQNGEDGVLAEIFRRIGTTNQFFVEFGCGNGLENNSLYLLHRDWRGLWIDGDPALTKAINRSHGQFTDTHQLRVDQAMVTAANIEQLFANAEVPTAPDVVSIDIDGNDYWVWQALEHYRPRVVVIEYNAFWPPDTNWVQTYAPTSAWNGTTYHGASVASLVDLAEKKGYRLVHCDLSGVNAFFVRDDEVGGHFGDAFDATTHYQPARYFLASVVARRRGFGTFETI